MGGKGPKELGSTRAKSGLAFTTSQSFHIGCHFAGYLGLVLGSPQVQPFPLIAEEVLGLPDTRKTAIAQHLTTHRIPHDLSSGVCNQ